METAFDEFILLEEVTTLGQLKVCRATTNGKKIKKGEEFLAKPYQIVKFETRNGHKYRIKEVHIVGKYSAIE